ncbi:MULTISPECIES: hypothetical protein [Deinococcus]|uniref:Uncharacterized protein n=1 Tax=Deinococcus rufus TaxID=2136097 RepID=A0ABV7Z750_9DEIO|nr:hypothetical protein [Deinococcus sp. AB2017081]WQE97148.1 hypothetical protein U2P90_18910 [Deinococcus sp. AB2017081]
MTDPAKAVVDTALRSDTWPKHGLSAAPDTDVLRREYGQDWNAFARSAGTAGTPNALIAPGSAIVLGAELTGDEAHLVATSTYFAQCSANAEVSGRRQNADQWFDAYLRGLSSLGCWQSTRHIDQPFETLQNDFTIDQAVADLLRSAAGYVGTADTLLSQLVDTLTQKGNTGKVRLLDESIRVGNNLNFMYAVGRKVNQEVRLGLAHLDLDIDDLKSSFLGLHFHRTRARGVARMNGLTLNLEASRGIAAALYTRMDSLVLDHLKNVPLQP